MDKDAQFSTFSPGVFSAGGGPTLGSLEHKIMMDSTLAAWEKDIIRQKVRQEVGFSTPSSTPLAELLPKLGGGALGFVVAKYFQMSVPGQVISTLAGYGIGKVLGDFYNAGSGFLQNDNQHRVRSLI